MTDKTTTTTRSPADPMDWPLPCDVTVGHGTMRKGVRLGTLVTRMKVLYEMATGHNADEVASRTIEQRKELAQAFFAQPAPTSEQAGAAFPMTGDEDESDLGEWQSGSTKPTEDGTYLREFDEGVGTSEYHQGKWLRDGFFPSDIQDARWRGRAAPASGGAVPVAEGDAEDAARYRAFFDAGLPITFLGEQYYDKAALDAAIDATRAQVKKGGA